MSRSKHKTAHGMGLFPFLAVLICSMGTLLVLLVLTTQRARSNAIAQARAAAIAQQLATTAVRPATLTPVKAMPLQLPPDPNIALRNHIEQLERERAGIAGQFQSQRQEVADATNRLTAAQAELDKLHLSLEEYHRLQSEDAKSHGELEATHAQGAIQVDELRRRLRLLNKQQASASSKFAFVAYDGHSGTTRRPIFIECTEKGLRFLPENIVVTAEDIKGCSRSFNPLLSGADSLLKYWKVKNRLSTDPESEPAPYVMFLIRPDGCAAFYAAREMLGNLKSPTGYELIDQDWQLSLPEADTEAVIVCRRAIADTIAQRSNDSDTDTEIAGTPPGGSSRRVGSRVRRGASGGGGSVFDDDGDEPLVTGTNGGGGAPSAGSSGTGASRGQESSRAAGGTRSSSSGNTETGGGQTQAARSESMAQNSSGNGAKTLHRLSPVDGNSGDGGEYLVADKNGNVNAGGSGEQHDIVHLKPPKPLEDAKAAETASSASTEKARSGGGISPQSAGGDEGSVGFSDQLKEKPSQNTSKPLRRIWGTSNGRATIGYERPVTVEVHGDSIVVGGETMLRVNRGETKKELADGFMAALDEHVRTWGRPPKDFYWVPTLKYVVDPDGRSYYERVRGATNEIGLRASVELKPAAAAKAVGAKSEVDRR